MNVDTTTLGVLILEVGALIALLVLVDRRWTAAEVPNGSENFSSTAGRVRDVLLWAIWFGLVTSLVHLSLAFVNRYVRDHFLMVSPQIVWLAPIAYITLFLCLGLLLAVGALLSPRVVSRRLVCTVLAWLGVFGLLLPFRQLHPFASWTIAAGVAVQVGQLMARHQVRWAGLLRTGIVSMATAIVVVALGAYSWRLGADALALRRLPAARAGAPNVLLIVLDTVRATNLSLYGYNRPTTPELVHWAEGGTVYDQVFSTEPWTLKSHASMFTGLYPSQIGGDFEHPVSTGAPMLAEIFRDRGYMTGGFVANLPYASRESGLARGFIHYEDYRFSPRQLLLHSWIAHMPVFGAMVNVRSISDAAGALRNAGLKVDPDTFNNRTYTRKTAGEITSSFLDWESAHQGHPFFAFLNYFDAHFAYRAPPAFASRFALKSQPALGHYDAAISYIDHELGRLFEELQRRGVLDETIVIVTADHGEQFGEHGLTGHANSLYLPLLHVPLLMRFPSRIGSNVRVATPVSLRDLAATVIDLAGLGNEVRVPGLSLAARQQPGCEASMGSPVIAHVERAIRPVPGTPVAWGAMDSVIDDRFHYIRRGDGFEELYAYRTDPDEAINIGAAPEGTSELPRLRALLEEGSHSIAVNRCH